MKRTVAALFLCLLTLLPASAQLFKYLGVTEGLSDRRVLSIQKDSTGYMWFLTYTGIDRFDGKDFKRYPLTTDDGYVSFYSEKNILKTDSQGQIWTISPDGQIFYYDPLADDFHEIVTPEEFCPQSPELSEMTDKDEIWLCLPEQAYIYDTGKRKMELVKYTDNMRHLLCICQTEENNYFVGTAKGIFQTHVEEKQLKVVRQLLTDSICHAPQTIYYHARTNRLLTGSNRDGMMVYNLTHRKIEHRFTELCEFPITSIVPYGDDCVLIATRGAGVYLYDFMEKELHPFFTYNGLESNKMNGNHIRTLYMDDKERIWMSVYPIGITVYDKDYPAYTWLRHHIGNPASLGDDQVNSIMEDSDGDIWYATGNGISIYNRQRQEWKHLFAHDEAANSLHSNYTFLTLCETEPGTVLAGGYMTGVYRIEKKTRQTTMLTNAIQANDTTPMLNNKFIRVIHRDDEGLVWTGGNYYLKCTNLQSGEWHDYFIGNAITSILQQDSTTLLVGTGNGLYRLDKTRREVRRLRMPFASQHINTLYRHSNGDLYVGTTNSGLAVLRPDGTYKIYTSKNSALLNNIINTILPQDDTHLVISTDQNITVFDIANGRFDNWTEDQGLIKASFNPRAGIRNSQGGFIFGSNNGAIETEGKIELPKQYYSKVVIDQILIDNKRACTTENVQKSQVTELNSIEKLTLQHNDHTVAFHIASINYDNPKHTYYQWRLQGKYEYWTRGNSNNWIQYRDLPPGEYTLHIRNIAQEDGGVIGEKTLQLVVLPSFWETGWAALFYLVLLGFVSYLLVILFRMKEEQRVSRIKLRHFSRTINHMRVSLSIIRSSAGEVLRQKGDLLDHEQNNYLKMAIGCAGALQRMTGTLLRTDAIRREQQLHISQRTPEELVRQTVEPFRLQATQRNLTITCHHEGNTSEVWMDAEKVQSVIQGLLASLLAKTPALEEIKVVSFMKKGEWGVTLSNHPFPTKNAPVHNDRNRHSNSQMIKEELLFVRQLVKLCEGKLAHTQHAASYYSFTIKFPLEYTRRLRKKKVANSLPVGFGYNEERQEELLSDIRKIDLPQKENQEKRGFLLIVDKQTDTLNFLDNALCDEWEIVTTSSVSIAKEIIQEQEPDIILTGLIYLEDGQTDFCTLLKSDKETNHIPLLLMTSNEETANLEDNFTLRADHIINKAFNLHVIRALLINIIDNRRSLQERLAKSDAMHHLKENQKAHAANESSFLQEMNHIIKEHICDKDFTADTLCTLMRMSRTSLYNRVKVLTGKTLIDIIRDVRMQRAGELLLSNQYTISEVSDLLGFNETKYFREVFRKHYGMTPSEYIKQQDKKAPSETDRQ